MPDPLACFRSLAPGCGICLRVLLPAHQLDLKEGRSLVGGRRTIGGIISYARPSSAHSICPASAVFRVCVCESVWCLSVMWRCCWRMAECVVCATVRRLQLLQPLARKRGASTCRVSLVVSRSYSLVFGLSTIRNNWSC